MGLSTSEATKRRWFNLQQVGLIIVVLLLGTILSVYGYYDSPPGAANTFLNSYNLLNSVASPMSTFAIMAVGLTVVIITGGIDISVGSIFALSALGAAAVLQQFDPETTGALKGIGIALIVSVGIGLLCGLFNGVLVTQLRMHPFIVTLGTMSIFRGLTDVLPREPTLPYGDKSLPTVFTKNFMMWQMSPGVMPVPLIVMLVTVIVGWFFLSKMIAGREVYAIGGNEEAARFSGLRVKRIKLMVYAISGAMAGLAAMVSLGRFGSTSTSTGQGYELTVIAAAVVGGASLTGGRGSAIGALFGTLIIQLIQNGIVILHLKQEYSLIIIGSSIIVAVAIDRISEGVRSQRVKKH